MVYNNLKAKEMLDVLTLEELKNPRWVTDIIHVYLQTYLPGTTHMLSVLRSIQYIYDTCKCTVYKVKTGDRFTACSF